MYSVIFLCDELLKFVKEQGFKESTLVRYRRSLNVFIKFCDDKDVINYTPEIGQEFANDLIPKGSNKVSADRKSFRRKAVQHFDHYLEYGCFVFEHRKRKSFDSESLGTLDKEYKRYKKHIIEKYNKQNTRKFYLYEVYIFLSYLALGGINNITSLTAELVLKYLSSVKENRLKASLCVLRYYFRFIDRQDLYNVISTIRPVSKKKLIPYLTKKENEKIWTVLKGNEISYKDKAVFLLGFTLGIRVLQPQNIDARWIY